MFSIRQLLFPLFVALFSATAAPAQDPKLPAPRSEPSPREELLTKPFEDRRELTLLRKITERTFVHDAARMAYTVPDGWKVGPPHRLARKIDPRISTVLGIESGPRNLVASLNWMPMNPGQRLGDWVKDDPVKGEYGEEYETLKAVYGKDRVSVPVKEKHGPFEMYRINITGGPDRGEKYDGSLFLFEVESAGNTWLVKARVSYPKAEKSVTDQYVDEVLKGFDRLPDSAPAPKKVPEIDVGVPPYKDPEKR